MARTIMSGWPGQGCGNSRPSLPTHEEGSALAKFLLPPGRDIPEFLLSPMAMPGARDFADESENIFPAATYPSLCIANRYPARLTLEGRAETPPKMYRATGIGA